MSDLYLSLEILGYGFVSCCFIGMVVCTSKTIKNCYDKYILRLPAPEEPIDVNNPFYNLTGRYAKATVSIVIPETIHYVNAEVTENKLELETNIIAVEIV